MYEINDKTHTDAASIAKTRRNRENVKKKIGKLEDSEDRAVDREKEKWRTRKNDKNELFLHW